MPYKVSGKTVYVKKRGMWVKKATAKSKASAARMLKLLRGMKSGSIKRKRKARKK
jgi:hypothetical protein